MNIQFRGILPIASLAFALATWFPNQVSADELKEAKVTQVIQDVKVLPSNAAPRPATVNDNVGPGQQLTYDPIANRLEDPVDADLNQVLTSPLIKDFRRLPSASLIDQTIRNRRQAAGLAYGSDALTHAVQVAGASSVATATPDQFLRALNSLFARSTAAEVCGYVGAAVRARPDLAPQIVVAALRVTSVNPRTAFKDFKQPVGKEISCDEANCIYQAAIAAHPSAAKEIYDAAIAAAPLLRDCFTLPCPLANAPVQPVILAPINPATFVPPVVSPEQPPSGR